MKTVTVSSYYEYDPEDFWRLIQKPSTLNFITQGFVSFDWLDPLSEDWLEGVVYRVRFKIFGIIPMGGIHSLKIEKIDHIDKILRSQESNDLIQIWNHDLIVQKENDLTKYTDRIDIEAGFLTSFVCIFAKCFYRHRQRRLNLLIDKST